MAKLARVLVIIMACESVGASVGFAFTGNWKLAAYWFFVGCINAVASTL